MRSVSKEFLGTCDCMSADGETETIATYRMGSGDNVFYRSKHMLPARWCPQTQAFFVEGQDKPYRPTEPSLLLAG